MRLICFFVLLLFLVTASPATDRRLKGSFREDRNGWVYVHLHGSAQQIGFQNGYWNGPEIEQIILGYQAYMRHTGHASYEAEKKLAHRLWWGKIPAEYRDEINGVAEGARARGCLIEVDDVLYLNGCREIDYYHEAAQPNPQLGHCSAFIATGSQTKNGRIVMGHNNWNDYMEAQHDHVIMDLWPSHGHHILMDSTPGFIHSGDDFAINDSGLMMTETTICDFVGYDAAKMPEFVRMRQAIQYGSNIDDAVGYLKTDNNGGYANTWLLGDANTDEIAELELGLKNVILHRTFDGAFEGANAPIDAKLAAEECPTWALMGQHNFCSDRMERWQQLMEKSKGKVDAEMGKAFLADHVDVVANREQPSMSTICGHGETDARKDFAYTWTFPHLLVGAVQGKVCTSELAKHMSFWARMGHPCGTPILVDSLIKGYPAAEWERPYLHDLPTEPWTLFSASK